MKRAIFMLGPLCGTEFIPIETCTRKIFVGLNLEPHQTFKFICWVILFVGNLVCEPSCCHPPYGNETILLCLAVYFRLFGSVFLIILWNRWDTFLFGTSLFFSWEQKKIVYESIYEIFLISRLRSRLYANQYGRVLTFIWL